MLKTSITKLTLYTSNDFLDFLTLFFDLHPCPLCKTNHKFSNHGRVTRLVRDNNTYENVEITIFVLYCAVSKKAGKQYTKRMLPPFVIPECNITLENSWQLVEQFPQKPIDYDKACQILGTFYEETVKRHYQLITEVILNTINLIISWLAAYPLFGIMPTKHPANSLFSFFNKCFEELIAAQEKLIGYTHSPAKVIFLQAYVMMVKKVRKSLNFPLNLNSIIRFLFDTS